MSWKDQYARVVYDCEVFAYDWLFCFKENGKRTAIWNDSDALKAFVDEHGSEAVFIGFNSSHYDQWIAKAIVTGCEPEQVKEVNDYIIGTGNLAWEHPYLSGKFVDLNDVDLMKDTQYGTSLKSVEGHVGMSVEESSVPFDIDRPLTQAERDEVEAYCFHDVDATERLLELRTDYLDTKAELGLRAGLPVPRALALTNAKLTAKVLKATRREHHDEDDYRIPDNLRREFIPEEVLRGFETGSYNHEIEVDGCPVTLGIGGIHGALPKWRGKTTDSFVLMNADVASYYPSLMVKCGYTSRNMPNPSVFAEIYEERLAAKAAGDKRKANALKLVVNTTYGATINEYNDLCDPLMGRSVCLSGQLYLLELACHLVEAVRGLVLVQLNTDGILFGAPKGNEVERALREVFDEWQDRTGFEMEFDPVERIWQKDVNNYAMRLMNGTEKVKGSYLVRGVAKAGAFAINNNATIVADALKAYLLDGVPVEDTIRACDDPRAFQLIAKASHKYSSVYQERLGADESGMPCVERVEVQRCNRVFAAKRTTLGRLFKVKAEDGSVAKIEALPDSCLIANSELPSMEDIDVNWYIALARKRALDFEGSQNMTTTEKKTTPKAASSRANAQKKAEETVEETADYSRMNVLRKLAVARKMFLESKPKKTGKNRHLEFTYWTLDDIVPHQTRIFEEVGLLEKFTYQEPQVIGRHVDENGEVDIMGEPVATVCVYNIDAPDEFIEFKLRWSEVAPIVSKEGKVVNNPVQDLGMVQTYLRRYLKMQVLDLAEPDALDASLGEESDGEKPSKPKPTPRTKGSKPATQSERNKAVKKMTENKAAADGDAPATKMQVAQLRKQLKTMKETYGEAHPEVGAFIGELSVATDKLENVTKAQCQEAIAKLAEMKTEFEKGE